MGLGFGIFGIYRRRISLLEQEKIVRKIFQAFDWIAEYERQRIMQELHDSLSQNLVIIRNRAISAWLRQMIAKMLLNKWKLPKLLPIRFRKCVKSLIFDHFRLTVWVWPKAIQGLVRRVSSNELEVEAILDDIDGILAVEMEINLYRIIQKSLNNMVKHSQATKGEVRISKMTKNIEIIIKDNGKGFDINSLKMQNSEK